jgi:penicillin-binding protein 1B
VPVKVQVPKKKSGLVRILMHPFGKAILGTIVLTLSLGLIVFTYYYAKYSRLIETKLASPFGNTSTLYAAPRVVNVGDQATPLEVASDLRRAGYSESRDNRMGHFVVDADSIEVYPGPDSYFKRDDGVIKFAGGKVSQIISLGDNTERTQYALEPELMSNLFDKNREKRRMVHYEDIPPVLVHAVISAEDKRFFQHAGFDPIRVLKSAYVDIRERHNAQGASTLSMQVAGMLFLDRSERTWSRKIPEVFITLHLEQKLSKEKIFEYYANQVPLGRRGSFGILGFGEAAQVYFGKNIKNLTIPEAATLAGLIQHPSMINPFRWPDRAKARRNVVLRLMYENNYITQEEHDAAVASPLVLAKQDNDSADAPYFVDLVNDTLADKFQDYDFQTNAYRIYTTLDPELQQDAAEAVRIGMQEVDKLIAHRKKRDPSYPDPQCTLIALDPQTGQVKALIGGRNYGMSQLNRAMAKRQPGSSFKPFVYAAALNTGLTGGGTVLTTASQVNDEPTTFWFDEKPYEPANFKKEYHGVITMREAIAHSANVAAVRFAEETGYTTVVDLARRAGMNLNIRPTPAVALGAYEVTPLEIAGAYTIFDNHGIFTKPNFIASISDQHGSSIFDDKPEHKQVLDPRVAFLMDSLLKEVVTTGTGAGIHGLGINFPVAGKTGTSHDGWFAGFSSKLICIVWVGFDDNRELNLEGAHSALPVWAEFMKRAHEHREYHNVSDFDAPAGIVSEQIDPASGLLAAAGCPQVRTEYFIEGTQPVEMCPLHAGGGTRVASWEAVPPVAAVPSSSVRPAPAAPSSQSEWPSSQQRASQTPAPSADTNQAPPAVPASQAKKERKGILGRIRDIFK